MLGECGVNPHRGHFMKKTVVKTAAPEPKEETQGSLNYREDLRELKELLKEMNERLKMMTGG